MTEQGATYLKRFPTVAGLVGGLTGLALLGSALAASPLQNGSFESGPAVGSFLQVNPGTTITGWDVEVAVDYIGTYFVASNGGRSIDMNASPSQGVISQTFATVPGATYDVTFDQSGNPACSRGPKTIRVSATGAASADYTFDTLVEANTLTNMKWRQQSYSFVATGTSTKLSFASQSGSNCGPALDNVAMTETLPNVAPVAQDDTLVTDAGVAGTVAVLANDSDADGGTLAVTAVTQGANGTVVINADGTVTYTPNAGFAGTDSFTYEVSDGQGGTATGTVTVTVNAVATEARMTGGGNISTGKGKDAKRSSWGFQIRCDASQGNFQYQDHNGGNFHLTSVGTVVCTDDPAVNPRVPGADFDTLRLTGTGRWNGVGGHTIEATLVDAGEPGSNDSIVVTVKTAGGVVVSTLSGKLSGGNHQAHK